LNYLERRNGVILRYFSEFGYLPGVLRKSSRSLSHLLMSFLLNILVKTVLFYLEGFFSISYVEMFGYSLNNHIEEDNCSAFDTRIVLPVSL